jgi:hypothetical protein
MSYEAEILKLSTEVKPLNVPVNTHLRETDTNKRFVFTGKYWRPSISTLFIPGSDVGGTADVPPNLPDAALNGDMLRWNTTEGRWEVVTAPFTFDLDEVNLRPKASSSGAEGTIFYCSDDNGVYVGVE